MFLSGRFRGFHVWIAGFIVFISCASVSSNELSLVRVLLLDNGEVSPSEKLQYIGKLEGSLLINGATFEGTVEVWKGKDSLYLINELPLEEYVKGVVASESGKDWPLEAYKVQAVLARTYALYHMRKRSGLPFHLTSTVNHQVFKKGPYSDDVIRAVEETKGEVLVYGGEPILALYHSSSSDTTEDPAEVFGSSYPYIRPVKVTARLSPYREWKKTIPLREIERATGISGIKDMVILSRTSTGRVKEVGLETSRAVIRLKATELRRLLGWQNLPSTDFDISRQEDIIIFSGRGYGHGVGLSQWSSLDMVLEGKTYREILNYFYPGAELKRL